MTAPSGVWCVDPQEEKQKKVLATADIARIVQDVAKLLAENYVFEGDGQAMADHIRRRLQDSAYDGMTTLEALSKSLTDDLRSVRNDAHLGVVDTRRFGGGGARAEDLRKEYNRKRMPYRNYGFQKVDRLPGNIGCIELDELAYVDMDGEDFAGDTARASLQLISNCSAVIFDLRDNFGGRDEMAKLLLGPFFKSPEHILTDKYRGRADRELWTPEPAFEGALADVPLYVLISGHTVSGGEMFAFVLKNRKRAVLVGETTRGAAHKTHLFPIKAYGLNVAIPVGTTVDPLTGTDWEGEGVEPDIPVPSGKALDTAYLHALEQILKTDPDRWKRVEIEWAKQDVDARLNPVILTPKDLETYTGQYGERRITSKGKTLVYLNEGGDPLQIKPMSKDLFKFEDQGMFYVRLEFRRDESGKVDTLVLLYDTGQRREYPKSH
jgi:hypothetical protein